MIRHIAGMPMRMGIVTVPVGQLASVMSRDVYRQGIIPIMRLPIAVMTMPVDIAMVPAGQSVSVMSRDVHRQGSTPMTIAPTAAITTQVGTATAPVCRRPPGVHKAEEDITEADTMDVGRRAGLMG